MKRLEYAFKKLVCLLALSLAGCTTAYSVTAASLVTANKIVQAAAEQFPPFDKDKRTAIVNAATSRDAGAAALNEWTKTSDTVVKAIEGAHASVQLGADGLKGVRDGLRNPKDLGTWVAPAIRVGLDLINLLAAVGLKLQLVR
jgi:hypothetical protein